MSLLDAAAKHQRQSARRQQRSRLDEMYDLLPADARKDLVTMMQDPWYENRAIARALSEHPVLVKAGLSVSDTTISAQRAKGWTPDESA